MKDHISTDLLRLSVKDKPGRQDVPTLGWDVAGWQVTHHPCHLLSIIIPVLVTLSMKNRNVCKRQTRESDPGPEWPWPTGTTPPMSVIVSTLVYLYIKVSTGVADRSGRHGILTLAWEGRKEGRKEGRRLVFKAQSTMMVISGWNTSYQNMINLKKIYIISLAHCQLKKEVKSG